MAELVQINGETYKKRGPLAVLGLTIITFGIYYFYWYYQVNDELRRYERDESISPTRSLMAVLFGWIIIVPPFIAMYNTAKHIQQIRDAVGVLDGTATPEEINDYKRFIVHLAHDVAAAHREGGQDVSPAESDAIQAIADTIGVPAGE